MRKMKFLTAAGAAALMLTGAMATTAQAQPWRDRGPAYDHGYRGGYGGGHLTTSYVDSLEWRIHSAAQEGRISWGEARQLLREFRSVQNLAWRVQTGEASPWEHRRLANVVSRIEAATSDYPRHGYNRWR